MLAAFHDRIEGAARVKRHLLSRAAIVPDHIHVLPGCPLQCSPEEIVLSYMNTLCGTLRG